LWPGLPGHQRKAWDSNPYARKGTRISNAVRPTVSGNAQLRQVFDDRLQAYRIAETALRLIRPTWAFDWLEWTLPVSTRQGECEASAAAAHLLRTRRVLLATEADTQISCLRVDVAYRICFDHPATQLPNTDPAPPCFVAHLSHWPAASSQQSLFSPKIRGGSFVARSVMATRTRQNYRCIGMNQRT